MTNTSLAESYLIKARVRLEVLDVPTDAYTRGQAQQALADAAWVVSVAGRVIGP